MNYQQQAPWGYVYPNNFGPGMVPNANMPVAHAKSWLTPEQRSSLQKTVQKFNLAASEEDVIKGNCNHYNENGTCALVPDADGSDGYTCSICGTHFTMRDFTKEEVQNATDNILDILNNIKVMYLSLDPSAATTYFQIIPFIEKVPKLYDIASTDFKKYDNAAMYVNGYNRTNAFDNFRAMNNPGMFGAFGGYQQPMYGMPQQPMGYQQPAYGYAPQGMNPMYGQYQQPAPQPQAGYQPQAQGFAMNPQGAAAPQQPQANVYQGGYAQAPVAPQPQVAPAQQPTAPTPVAAPTQAPQAPATDVKVDTQFQK